MIDTHCHLYLDQFESDRSSVISKAVEAGVSRMLTPGIDYSTSEQSCKLAEKNPGVIYSAAGIHPNYSSQTSDNSINLLYDKYQDQIIAIGEIGLDYYRDYAHRDTQIFVFTKMLELARRHNLPICLHNREAEDDLLQILSKWYPSIKTSIHAKGVFHAFNGSTAIARWGISHGFMFGIGGMITYKKSRLLREVVKDNIGLERIILETDSPYLTPTPFRGKRNTPANITIIAEVLADIFSTSVEEVSQITDDNATLLFGFK